MRYYILCLLVLFQGKSLLIFLNFKNCRQNDKIDGLFYVFTSFMYGIALKRPMIH